MTTETGGNTELIRAGYAAFNRGDLEAVLDLFAPDIEFLPLPDSPIGTVYRGHEGFRGMIAENSEMFDSYRSEPEEIVEVDDDHVIVTVRSAARGRMSGVEVGGRLAHLWTIVDGKAARCESFDSAAAAMSAAQAGERR
jgi:uncharacterized protein